MTGSLSLPPAPDLDLLLPRPQRIAVAELLRRLDEAPALEPFSAAAIALCADLSARLLGDMRARNRPALQALGFWLRPAALERLRRTVLERLPPDTLAVPRGLAFLVPAGNVDTLFAYPLALSLLAGNRSVLRLSGRLDRLVRSRNGAAGDAAVLLGLLAEAMERTPDAAASVALVGYGHDDAVSAALSAACDLRAVWGGDDSIAHLRRLPLPARALDLAFGDRSSLMALDCAAVLALDGDRLDRLAEDAANDLYWFDQGACASPRILVWCGGAEQADEAADRLLPRLDAAAQRASYRPDPSLAMAKLTALHRTVLDLPVTRCRRFGNRLAVLTLERPERPAVAPFGAGTLLETRIPAIEEIAPLVGRADQTLGVFGFPPDQLRGLARRLNGRGIDRIVPVGRALSFGPVWDGVELPRQFLRLVEIDPHTAHSAFRPASLSSGS